MDLNQYVKDAIATESLIENVKVDPRLLASTLQILIAAGSILDQIKKNAFYDKPYEMNKIIEEFTNIVASLDGLKEVATTGIETEATMYNPRVFHSIIGIATESVELLEAMNSEDFDTVNFLEELGDLNWYEAIGIDAVNGNFDDVLATNIEKLQGKKGRYKKGKFEKDAAQERDLDLERDILEAGFDDDGC